MRFPNSFQIDECSIPEEMTISEYRRSQYGRSEPPRRRTWRERRPRITARRKAKSD